MKESLSSLFLVLENCNSIKIILDEEITKQEFNMSISNIHNL